MRVRWFISLFAVVVAVSLVALPAAATAAPGSALACVYADALKRDGDRQAAHAAYLKVLAADPSSVCANAGVEATIAPSKSFWKTVGDVAKDAASAIAAILLALLLLAVAVLLLLQVLTRTPWLRDRWPAKGIRRPAFSVAPLTDSPTDPLGSAVAGLIRGRVTWRTDGFGLNVVSGQAGVASAFSGLGGVSGEAKAAVAVLTALTALLPRRRFELTGQLQPAGDEGVGISLELSQNGQAEALTSLWAESFHCPADSSPTAYQQLAVASAAWVDIEMTKAFDPGGLLTTNAQSWAFFRTGMDAQRLGDPKRAQVLYEQALAADGTNVGAMANLGIIYRRTRRYADADDYLNRALLPIEGTAMAPHLPAWENPDWYRIKYQLAALYANWAADSEPGANKETRTQRSVEEARALAGATLEALDGLTTRRRGHGQTSRAYQRDTLCPFLEGTIEPSALALLAGTVMPLPQRPEGWPGERPTRADLIASLAANVVDPWQLIAYVELGHNRPPETEFNLACFYTRAGDLTTASKRLLRSVRETQRQERQRLVDAALIDPVLAPLLQKRPGFKAKLYEMLDATAPFPDVDALTEHFDRQDRTISHFQGLGFNVAWDVDTKDIDLTASKDSQTLLIRLPGPTRTGDTLHGVFTGMQSFEEQHPNLKNVKASMIIPAITDYPAEALAAAQELGLEVIKDTGHGFESVDAALARLSSGGAVSADPPAEGGGAKAP